MESYNLLHAHNELAHSNRMMLQASNTLGILIICEDDNGLEEISFLLERIGQMEELPYLALVIEKISPEEVHSFLLQHDLEPLNALFLYLKETDTLDMNELFLGQEFSFKCSDGLLTDIDDPETIFNLNDQNGSAAWKNWLAANIPSQEIEYYDPETD